MESALRIENASNLLSSPPLSLQPNAICKPYADLEMHIMRVHGHLLTAVAKKTPETPPEAALEHAHTHKHTHVYICA